VIAALLLGEGRRAAALADAAADPEVQPMADALAWADGGRDRLAYVVRAIGPGAPATDPLAVIGHATMRRDLARLTGDGGRAAAWQAVAERYRQAFSSDTPLTALMVRELLRAADRGER
jgi:hypothetical protein